MLSSSVMAELLTQYQALLYRLDRWFNACMAHAGDQIRCRQGCSACCRGLFEISLLDALLLQRGFLLLDTATSEQVLRKARWRVNQLQTVWPEFCHPYILNHLPHDDWQEMPEEDATPCPLLSRDGGCLVYEQRPMTCRLHGLPNIDLTGESFSDAYCTLNFTDCDPLEMPNLRFAFRKTFTREFNLLGSFAVQHFGHRQLELDTFIASALLINFAQLTGE